MKILFLSLIISFYFVQCVSSGFDPVPTIDESSVQLMNKLKPQIEGVWEVRQAQINHKELGYFQSSPGITKDTLLQYLATVTLRLASGPNQRTPLDSRYGEFSGTVQFRNKTYPVYGLLSAGPNRLNNQQRLQGYLGLQFDFPVGDVHLTSPEEDYLRGIGLINDTFAVEIISDRPIMMWRGLNRAITSAALQKK